jgi:hypothetical protein
MSASISISSSPQASASANTAAEDAAGLDVASD